MKTTPSPLGGNSIATTVSRGHRPVLLDECLQALNIKADGFYIDATFGRGGHSRAILSRLGDEGRLLALDRDPSAEAVAQELAQEDSRFSFIHAPFADLGAQALPWGKQAVDGVLFDVGVSSPQLDEAERGFSFRANGPLDMRMDTTQGVTAAEWLARASTQEITEVLKNYGQERCAVAVAKALVAYRAENEIRDTETFARIVRSAVRTREPGQDAATRSFQAVRIHINQELSQLALALPQAVALLNHGGRLAVIAFHSLEDRIVKQFMNEQAHPERELPDHLPLKNSELPAPVLRLCGKAQRADAAEVQANPRSRSAVLRVAEKC